MPGPTSRGSSESEHQQFGHMSSPRLSATGGLSQNLSAASVSGSFTGRVTDATSTKTAASPRQGLPARMRAPQSPSLTTSGSCPVSLSAPRQPPSPPPDTVTPAMGALPVLRAESLPMAACYSAPGSRQASPGTLCGNGSGAKHQAHIAAKFPAPVIVESLGDIGPPLSAESLSRTATGDALASPFRKNHLRLLATTSGYDLADNAGPLSPPPSGTPRYRGSGSGHSPTGVALPRLGSHTTTPRAQAGGPGASACAGSTPLSRLAGPGGPYRLLPSLSSDLGDSATSVPAAASVAADAAAALGLPYTPRGRRCSQVSVASAYSFSDSGAAAFGLPPGAEHPAGRCKGGSSGGSDSEAEEGDALQPGRATRMASMFGGVTRLRFDAQAVHKSITQGGGKLVDWQGHQPQHQGPNGHSATLASVPQLPQQEPLRLPDLVPPWPSQQQQQQQQREPHPFAQRLRLVSEAGPAQQRAVSPRSAPLLSPAASVQQSQAQLPPRPVASPDELAPAAAAAAAAVLAGGTRSVQSGTSAQSHSGSDASDCRSCGEGAEPTSSEGSLCADDALKALRAFLPHGDPRDKARAPLRRQTLQHFKDGAGQPEPPSPGHPRRSCTGTLPAASSHPSTAANHTAPALRQLAVVAKLVATAASCPHLEAGGGNPHLRLAAASSAAAAAAAAQGPESWTDAYERSRLRAHMIIGSAQGLALNPEDHKRIATSGFVAEHIPE